MHSGLDLGCADQPTWWRCSHENHRSGGVALVALVQAAILMGDGAFLVDHLKRQIKMH
jgi:hypothetical protein